MDHYPLTQANLEGEEWRPVPRWEGYYEVSSLGRIKSLPRKILMRKPGVTPYPYTVKGGICRPIIRKAGSTRYYGVCLAARSESRAVTCCIQYIVAEAFLGVKPEGLWILHGPGGSLDNRVENLSYGTPSQNAQDRWRDGTVKAGEDSHLAKLTEAQVVEIYKLKDEGLTQASIAARFGITQAAVSCIVLGKTWKALFKASRPSSS